MNLSAFVFASKGLARRLGFRLGSCVLLFAIGLAVAAPESNLVIGGNSVALSSGKRVALVIGNGAYAHTLSLPNPVNDADDVAGALRGFGFEVIELKNATRRQMSDKLAEFSRRVTDADAALVYYAGHGAQIRGENYLLPVDVTTDSEAGIKDESISLNRVLDELDDAHNRVNIVMLDACRDNPVTGRFRGGQRGLAAPSSPPKGTVIVFATDPGNTAADGEGRNGMFTAGLLKAFRGNDLTLDGVLTVASAEVERATNNRQTPYVNGPKTVQKQFQFAVTVEPGPRQIEADFWASIKNSRDPADFDAYLAQYPQGNFRRLAENRLRVLRPSVPVPAVPAAPPGAASSTGSAVGAPATAPTVVLGAPSPVAVPPPPQSPLVVFQDRMADGGIGPEMVVIPAGEFDMGANDGDADEKPVHRVRIPRPFALGKTEVTQAQWRQVMGGDPPELGFKGCDECPVERVSWGDIHEFIKTLNAQTGQIYRLPSEAEWEYACRAGKPNEKHCGGNDLGAVAWVASNSGKRTQLVGRKKANAWGLFDMTGNVWEALEDVYHDSYQGAPADGSAWVAGADANRRVLRGGSWGIIRANDARVSSRSGSDVTNRINYVGFRLARTIQP